MPRPRPSVLIFRILTVLVAVTGMLLTFYLARTGHETAGLVAVMTVLVPLLASVNKER